MENHNRYINKNGVKVVIDIHDNGVKVEKICLIMKRPFSPELPEQSMSQPENGVLRRRRWGVGYEEGSAYEEVFWDEEG